MNPFSITNLRLKTLVNLMVSDICLNHELQNRLLESKMVALHSSGEVSCKFLELKELIRIGVKDCFYFRCSDDVLLPICELALLDV